MVSSAVAFLVSVSIYIGIYLYMGTVFVSNGILSSDFLGVYVCIRIYLYIPVYTCIYL